MNVLVTMAIINLHSDDLMSKGISLKVHQHWSLSWYSYHGFPLVLNAMCALLNMASFSSLENSSKLHLHYSV